MRTYSIDHGLDQIPDIARRHGLKVMQGLWLSSQPDKNRQQIETTVALAKQYPDVIEAIVVGNEVLLRGEMSAPDLAETIREVKAQVPMPVTYADVWEFWLRYRDVRDGGRFRHHPHPAVLGGFPDPGRATPPRHVDAIRKQVAAAFPGKEILIGEFGWPSAGRMREGALPSPVNQARVLHDVLALAKRGELPGQRDRGLRPALEAPLEGTVGGHWGLFDAYRARAEIRLGRRGLQPSALALAGGRRRDYPWAPGLRGRLGRAPPWAARR